MSKKSKKLLRNTIETLREIRQKAHSELETGIIFELDIMIANLEICLKEQSNINWENAYKVLNLTSRFLNMVPSFQDFINKHKE